MLPPVAALRSSLDLLFRWIAWLYSIDADILRIDRQKAYPIPFHRHETHVWIRTASTHLPSHRSSSDGNSTHGGVRPTETSESAAPRPEPRATRSFATMSTGIAKGRIPSVQHHCHASCSAAMTARRAHTIHKATGHDLAAHGTTQGGVPCHANATRVLPMGRGARGKTDHKRGHTSLVENDTTCCKPIERGVRLVAYSKAVNPAAHGLAGGLARPSAVTNAYCVEPHDMLPSTCLEQAIYPDLLVLLGCAVEHDWSLVRLPATGFRSCRVILQPLHPRTALRTCQAP